MLGWQEIILVLALLLLVVGPGKLPEIARELGKIIAEFRKASGGVSDAIVSSQTVPRESKEITDITRKLGINTERRTEGEITGQTGASVGKSQVERTSTAGIEESEVKN
ncbi:MAG TPA: twin-arginine translocase TatA/TatE family subunit [Candidatus Bathyarchaeia archaeon]|nr:twin-arginine translocase TatA/TatE family subunit [Candidatus Bathyarchaeia archaeon]